MKNTTAITIYHKGADGKYTRKVIQGCFWDDDQQASIAKTGISNADRLYISIPYRECESLMINKSNDLVIKGDVVTEIDNTSSSSISTSIKTLKAEHEVFTLTSCSFKNHGSRRMWHYELSGK